MGSKWAAGGKVEGKVGGSTEWKEVACEVGDIKPRVRGAESSGPEESRGASESEARDSTAAAAAAARAPTTTAHLVSSRRDRRTYQDNNIMLVWAVLLLAAGLVVDAAKPDPPDITTVGSQKLATASDCSKPVAFSGTHANVEDARLVLTETLLDKGVGYASNTGIFTTFCPGLYQFSFAGYGSSDLRLTLKRKLSKTETWQPVVSSGPSGGANIVLLRMALGDQVAVFVESGKTDDSTTFSGYRIAKE